MDSKINKNTALANRLLFEAILSGNTEKAAIAISNGADTSVTTQVDYRSKHYTPLSLACLKGRDEIAKILLDNGAPTKKHKKEEYSPLWIAISHDKLNCIEILLEHGADPNELSEPSGQTPLMHVSAQARPYHIRLFVKHGADITVADASGNTAIMCAAKNYRRGCVRELVSLGGDVDEIKSINIDYYLEFKPHSEAKKLKKSIEKREKNNKGKQNSVGL